jgi:hypothetical protein
MKQLHAQIITNMKTEFQLSLLCTRILLSHTADILTSQKLDGLETLTTWEATA